MESMNDFKEELEASFRELHVGDIVDGTVIGVSEEGVTVDLKYYTQGFIRRSELSDDPTFNAAEELHEGDEIKAMIRKMDDGNGSIALSRKAAVDVLAWEKLQEMMDNKEVVTVQILETVRAGVVTYLEGIRAFIPASQLSDAYVEDTSEWLDRDVDVRIITCDPDNIPSRRTCEGLGCVYERTVSVPEDILRKYDISPAKCRYIWLLGESGRDR